MDNYIMTDCEYRFTELIWNKEPLTSGDLVKLCNSEFGWKKSTTYTVLKKLCVNNILKNEESIVTALIKREDYQQIKSEEFIDENYDGSLPKFLTAFVNKKKLTKEQIEEIKKVIDQYEGDK
jgi:predicted transcriptional regulator